MDILRSIFRIFSVSAIFVSLLINVPPVHAETVFSDDFENGLTNWTPVNVTTANTVSVSSEQSHSGSNSLVLQYQNTAQILSAEHTFPTPQTGTVSVWFWDDMDTSMDTFIELKDQADTKIIAVGVDTGLYPTRYAYRSQPGEFVPTFIPRSLGWHKLELVSTPKGSYGKIDGNNLAWLPSNANGVPALNTAHTAFSKITITSREFASSAYYDTLTVTSLDPLPLTNKERIIPILDAFLDVPPDYTQGVTIHQYRNRANRALVLIVRNRNKPEAIELLRQLAQDVDIWDGQFTGTVAARNMGFAAWLIWNELDTETRNLIQTALVGIAGLPGIQTPQTGYIGDSKGESNSWSAAFFALMTNMYPDHPKASVWHEKAKLFAFHTLTTEESYGGITTQTLHPDYLLDNHNFHPYPQYALGSIGNLASGAFFYNKTGRTVPSQFTHNVVNVWNAHKPYFNLNTYLYQSCEVANTYGGKGDGGADIIQQDITLKYMSILLNNNLYNNLTTFEFYTRREITGSFVKFSDVPYTNQSVDAKRNVYAMLYDDPDFHLTPVTEPSPTLTPPTTSTHTATPTSTPIQKPGDATGDGNVDGLDYIVWVSNYNRTDATGPAHGDFTGDGKVDGLDYIIWVGNYGR